VTAGSKSWFGIEQAGYSRGEVEQYINRLYAEYKRLDRLCEAYCARISETDERLNAANAEIKRLHGHYQTRMLELEAEASRLAAAGNTQGNGMETRETTENNDRNRQSRTFDILFYTGLAIALIVIFAFYNGGSGAPRSFMGYSAMRVLTESMQDEIPKDSLIVTKNVGAGTLEIGDDITFLVDADTTVTHRIIAIQENYANTGMRGFQTQGIMNSSPDREIVAAQNVVGKVVFHNLALGKVFAFVGKYAIWIGLFAAMFIGLFAALRVALKRDGPRPSASGVESDMAIHTH
jgi:signal peptidase